MHAPPETARDAAAPLAPRLDSGERTRLLSLPFGMNLIDDVDRVNVTIVAPVILADRGWDKAKLGGVMSATLLGDVLGLVLRAEPLPGHGRAAEAA